MNVTVLGSGRWGTFLAVYHSRRNNVKLWGLAEAPDFQELMATRKNAYLELPDNLELAQLCREKGYGFLHYPEIFKDSETGYANPAYFSADGIHLNGDGYRILLDYAGKHQYN